MQVPRKIHKDYFMVRLLKAEQQQKRERIGALFLPPSQVFMKQNLQRGEIVRIGERAARMLPEAQEGDTLYFHHCIEGTYENRGRHHREIATRYLLLEDEQYRYYLVPATDDLPYALGVQTKEGFFSAPQWLWGLPAEAKDSRAVVKSDGGLYLFENWKQTPEELKQKTAQLEVETAWIAKSGVKNENVRQGIQAIEREREGIAAQLNKKQCKPFTPVHYHWQLRRDCRLHTLAGYTVHYNMIGEEVTTLQLEGTEYSLLKTTQVFYLSKNA